MKRFIYVTIIMAASIAMCTACHDSEEDITPSGNYHPLRGEFPQGTTPYDTIISDISKKYGVYLLYKDVREQDLNREWVSQGTGDPYVAGYDEERADGVWNLPAEHLPFYVNFFNKHIFPNISAEFAWSALPVKIYMIHNLRTEPRNLGEQESSGTEASPFKSLKLNGLDHWAISFKESTIFGDDAELTMKQQRCIFMINLIYNSMNKGEIISPDEFWEGYDLGDSTLVNIKEGSTASNSMRNMGFIDAINDNFGTGRIGQLWKPMFTSSKTEVSCRYWRKGELYDLFVSYIMNAMWLSPTEFMQRYEVDKYPLIKEKYDFVVKYMLDKHGIDLVGISTVGAE